MRLDAAGNHRSQQVRTAGLDVRSLEQHRERHRANGQPQVLARARI